MTATNPGVMRTVVVFTFRSAKGMEFKIARRVTVSVKDANMDPALDPTSPFVAPQPRAREPLRVTVHVKKERKKKVRLVTFRQKSGSTRACIGTHIQRLHTVVYISLTCLLFTSNE